MNRMNLIAAGVLLLGALACDRNRTDEYRAGDASTTGATVSPGSDRSGAGDMTTTPATTPGTKSTTGTGTMKGSDMKGSEERGSNRMTDMGSAADRDRNLGITRDGGSMEVTRDGGSTGVRPPERGGYDENR